MQLERESVDAGVVVCFEDARRGRRGGTLHCSYDEARKTDSVFGMRVILAHCAFQNVITMRYKLYML